MSEFWKYFHDILAWPLIHAPGPLQGLVRGMAHALDETRDDVVYFRRQWFPALCEPGLVSAFGASRGLVRSPVESDAQFRTRVVNAWRWHMLGGKQQGLPEILAAYGYHVEAIENMRQFAPTRWAEFMVRLETPPHYADQQAQLDSLAHLVWLIQEYKPARSFFFRIYNDTNDRRPIIPGIGPKLGSGILSFWSGTTDPGVGDGDVVIAFGVKISLFGPPLLDGSPLWGLTELLTLYGPRRVNNFVLSVSRLSDTFIRRNPFVMSEVVSIGSGEDVYFSASWNDGSWNDRPWERWEGFTRYIPPFELGIRHTARSQLETGLSRLSGINERLGGVRRIVLARGVNRLGDLRLGNHGPVRTPVCLWAYEAERRSMGELAFPGAVPGQCWGSETMVQVGHSPWLNAGTWEEEGGWNDAAWDTIHAYMGISITEE